MEELGQESVLIPDDILSGGDHFDDGPDKVIRRAYVYEHQNVQKLHL